MFCANVLYFWVIGNSWFTMAFSGYVLCVATMICSMPVPESPRLLLAHGKEKEFKAAIDMLARWNKKSIDWSQIQLSDRIKATKFDKTKEQLIKTSTQEKGTPKLSPPVSPE